MGQYDLIASEYNCLGLGTFTDEILNSILQNGADVIKPHYDKTTKVNIENSGLQSSALRGLVHQGRNQKFRIFKELIDRIRTDEIIRTAHNS